MNINTILLYLILITLVGSSPIPSIPFIVANYKVNGLIIGFFVSLFSGLCSSSIQYKIGSLLSKKIIQKRFPKIYKKVLKNSKVITQINLIELTTLMLSGLVPSSIICPTFGFLNRKYKTFIIACFISSVPTQFIFIITIYQSEKIINFLGKFGIKGTESFAISISIISLIIFLVFTVTRLFLSKLRK